MNNKFDWDLGGVMSMANALKSHVENEEYQMAEHDLKAIIQNSVVFLSHLSNNLGRAAEAEKHNQN